MRGLQHGTRLRTPDGTTVTVLSGVIPAVHDGWMWDLTVPGNNDHDFYVLPAQASNGRNTYYVTAGDTPVLVHNTGGCWVGQGGPGTWGTVNESMSDRAAAYQTRVTGGVPRGMGYTVNGVKFDGFQDGTLIDAKGPGYAQGVKNGQFQAWYHGADDLVEQAQRQLAAAGGTPIEWRVAEPQAVTAIQNLFADNGITGINVVRVP